MLAFSVRIVDPYQQTLRAESRDHGGRCDVMIKVGAGVLATGTRHVPDFTSLAFRFLVAIDVEPLRQPVHA